MSVPVTVPIKLSKLRIVLALIIAPLAGSASAQADKLDKFDIGAAAFKRGEFEQAAEIWEDLANRGDHRAMNLIAGMYKSGQGVKQNARQACNWYHKAAKYSRPDSMYYLAGCYDDGIGGTVKPKKSARLLHKSAKGGYIRSHITLALKYLEGDGVEKDLSKAYAYLFLPSGILKYAAATDPGYGTSNKLYLPAEVETEYKNIQSQLTPEDIAKAKVFVRDKLVPSYNAALSGKIWYGQKFSPHATSEAKLMLLDAVRSLKVDPAVIEQTTTFEKDCRSRRC